MTTVINRWKNAFAAARTEESGDIVQVLLILAIFVGVVVAVATILVPEIQDRATKTGDCIASTSVGTGGAITGNDNC